MSDDGFDTARALALLRLGWTVRRTATAVQAPEPQVRELGAEHALVFDYRTSQMVDVRQWNHRPPGTRLKLVPLPPEGLQILAGTGEDLAWQDRALCSQTDPEAFFPELGGSSREAKRVCRSCEVRAECLDYVLAHDDIGRFGVWGGLSERERRRLRREAA
jgi:WhiB family redox-sensing transcriptional regulator